MAASSSSAASSADSPPTGAAGVKRSIDATVWTCDVRHLTFSEAVDYVMTFPIISSWENRPMHRYLKLQEAYEYVVSREGKVTERCGGELYAIPCRRRRLLESPESE